MLIRNFLRRAALVTVLSTATLLSSFSSAIVAPEPEGGKAKTMKMLDARVNAKDAWQRAIDARPEAAKGATAARTQATRIATIVAAQTKANPALSIQLSSLTGAPSSVVNKSGALTAAAPGKSSEAIVQDYLRSPAGSVMGLSAADIGDLKVLGDSAGAQSGLRMLRVEQRINGRPIFQSETRFLLDTNGRLMKHVGLMVPQARSLVPADPAGKLSAAAASSKLFASLGKTIADTDFTAGDTSADGRTELASTDAFVAGAVTAREVYFPLAPGVLVPAWSLVAFTAGDADWYSVVDAQTGDVLWRKNIRNYASTHEARFRVYLQADGKTPADSPAPQSPTTVTPGSGTQPAAIAPTIVKMSDVQDLVASPNGWINDCPGGVCTANETQTVGNNVLACLDRTIGGANTNVCDTDAASVLDGNGRPTGNPDANGRNRDFLGTAPRDFQTGYLPAPQGGNPEAGQTATGAGNNGTLAIDQFRRGVVTHLFYLTNWYHDQTFQLGFDEASANFQQTNFSGGGLGGDRVLADVQDGAGTNNANFATPPDGVSGRMQMYRFTGPTIDRDGSLDAEIVLHELTHGLSNRLVGNAAGLNWEPAGGMGEGWSDFYALSLLNNTNADDPNGKYAAGSYATYKLIAGYTDNYLYGIRRFPYCTDSTVNPLTWGDIDDVTNNLSGGIAASPVNFNGNGGMEVHNIGEIWANTLWQMRANIIADPAGANGDVPTGNVTALRLVTNGLKMTPIDPTFVDARDALLDADCAASTCANEKSIWSAFAKRGLGYRAETPYNVSFGYSAGHMAIKESFQQPYLDVKAPLTDVVINDSATNNNGAIDPGESFLMTVKLTNPWRASTQVATGVTATLSTSTAGVTIYTDTSTYANIAPSASVTGTAFKLGVASSMIAGAPIDFTLTTTSSLGTATATFRVRVGTRSGTDPVVTYTRTIPSPLAIPDNAPRGVTDTLLVNDDFEIADIDFRVDSVTHTFTGDLTLMLRSPDAVGVDFVSLIGGLTDGGTGDNITNMIVDDNVAFVTGNDMAQAVAADAPYSKSWRPVFNSPWAALAGFPDLAGATGTLSRFDGRSTKGTWTVVASDQFTGDTGTLNGWSMLVTPVHFNISAVTAAAAVTATKTVSGVFRVGQTVTYTVILTNTGTGNQADNAGNEFTDVLPSSLTLVNATATSGTATATVGTNTVTWNGSLAPLGGTTTITITATISAGTQGTTISNQGSVSFDANVDGTNDTTAQTDDPGVAGTANATVFTVQSAAVSATKTVAGTTFAPGSTVTYTVILSNSGNVATLDNVGNEFTDVLPAGLTLVSASATSGTAVATVGTNTVTWNGSIGASSTVTVTINATINAGTAGTTISNQGTVAFDADLNGSNESSALTDDPGVAGAANPTTFVVSGATVSATKTVSAGPYNVGGNVTYTIVLSNTGNAATTDNPGNELTDVLPAGLTLVSASASSGTAVATVATRTVTWNGGIAAGGSVTITINATITAAAAGSTLSNQASFAYDADLNGSNESTGVTDDPGVVGTANATAFVVNALAPQAPPRPVPTASTIALAALGLLLTMFGAVRLSRGRRM
jgi:uncharacterized repeat protein (TIGR01451 family)